MKTIIEKLAALIKNENEPFFDSAKKGWSEKDIEIVEKQKEVSFPVDYKNILLTFGSGLLEGEEDSLTFFTKEEFFEEGRIAESEELRGVFVFAYDNAGEYYFYNCQPVLQYKPFSVFKVSPGNLRWDRVVYLSEDLTKLLIMIIQGKDLSDYDYVAAMR